MKPSTAGINLHSVPGGKDDDILHSMARVPTVNPQGRPLGVVPGLQIQGIGFDALAACYMFPVHEMTLGNKVTGSKTPVRQKRLDAHKNWSRDLGTYASKRPLVR